MVVVVGGTAELQAPIKPTDIATAAATATFFRSFIPSPLGIRGAQLIRRRCSDCLTRVLECEAATRPPGLFEHVVSYYLYTFDAIQIIALEPIDLGYLDNQDRGIPRDN